MEFFCAQCQKKHDVGDISADMLSIGAKEIVEGVEREIDKLKEERTDKIAILEDLRTELCSFLNTFINDTTTEQLITITDENTSFAKEVRFNAFFALKGSTIQQRGRQSEESGVTNVTYTYKVTLEQIYDWYVHYSDNKEKVKEFEADQIGLGIKGMVVWSKVLRCEFDEHVKGTLYRVFPDNNYDERGNVRICPHCGRELSYASGMGDEIIVALAGAPRAGKTSCMVALLSTLYNNNLENFTMQVDGTDKKWVSLLKEITAYRMGLRVIKTPDKATEVPSFSFKIKIGDGSFKVLTIVDMPGEFWVREQGRGLDAEFFNKYAGLYENIDCVWFAISKATIKLYRMDPIEMERYRSKLTHGFNENLEQIEIADPHVLRNNLAELSNCLKGRGKKMPPFLVMVSKPDFFISSEDVTETCSKHKIYPVVGPDPDAYLYEQVRNSVAQANATEREAVLGKQPLSLKELDLWLHARNVRNYIQQVNEPFLRAIEDNCPDRFYISLSAYGWAAVDPDDYLGQLSAVDQEKYATIAKRLGRLNDFGKSAHTVPINSGYGAPAADPFGMPTADPFAMPAADPFAMPTEAPATATKVVSETLDPKSPVPYHETYPLLWTLAVNNALPVRHKMVTNCTFMGKIVDVIERDGCVRYDSQLECPAEEQERVYHSLSRNLLLRGAGKDLIFSKTTDKKRMTLHELLVHKRNRK